MNWLWPGALLLLALLPVIVAAYIWAQRRRRRFTVRYSSLALVRAALPQYSRLRRHLPFALFLVALASLMVALARPVATVSVPAGRTTIILAIDVSRSMRATDIPPSRIEAAAAAARSFIRSQQSNTEIGIVAFAGFAELIQPPTTDQEALERAIRSLTLGRGTAVGSGILESLDVIGNISPIPSAGNGSAAVAGALGGSFAPAIIVLLTDGVSTTGPLPQDAAQQAVDRGIRIYTIGFGTEDGGIQFGGGNFRRGIDEETLQQVAEMTNGAYYVAESAGELQQVFSELPASFTTRTETTEISVLFTALGAILAALAIGLALLWNQIA